VGLMILRHLLSILLLPFMVTVVVPRWLLRGWVGVDTRWPAGSGLQTGGRVLGVALLVAGLALFTWCVSLFARVGRGTLAPWDPTRRLVAVGPYRHVRNPMITGVAMVLAGDALFFGSRVLAAWLGVFVLINQVYFIVAEEPGLARRFGRSYLDYKAAVPRWLPRVRPWDGGD
jgi:protein-S-isoprenylcysteine O-methyltransferase Ste14